MLAHGTYEKRFTPAIEHPSFNIQWKSGFVIKCHSDYVLPLWSSNNLSEDLKEYKQIGNRYNINMLVCYTIAYQAVKLYVVLSIKLKISILIFMLNRYNLITAGYCERNP